ncbi:MAG: hypothetical protein P9L99_08165 [Candidatus Lernaella stagnicola]|nr:hypothetical protein [Candidatus Lernaella stagnicola]
MKWFTAALAGLALIFVPTIGLQAADFDPELHAKAADYQLFQETWHLTDLGAITGGMSFTDETRTERSCLHHQGDSMIWTGMQLGSEALRYHITGDVAARDNVIALVQYMDAAMSITQTPGYIARFAGIDQMPWNCATDKLATDGKGPAKVLGEGEWEGYYWIDETSRDQYSGYIWGMTLAYDFVGDEPTRGIIREQFRQIGEMLVEHDWHIRDQNGEYTGNGAAWIGFGKRVAWLLAIAHVVDEPYYWNLLDEQYAQNKVLLPADVWSWYNHYAEFYGNNLRHLDFALIFRLWPDRTRLQELWDVWQKWNRPWTTAILNPWFDSIHASGCLRLGICDEAEMTQIVDDNERTLRLYWDAPSYRREVLCSTQPLDPFSVWADEFLRGIPWLEEIINIDPISAVPREINDRHWTDMYWQSSGVFDASCHSTADPTYTGPGMDYLVAYWMNVYYGLLPGDGPYGDDDLIEPGDDDDTTDDDDDDNDDDDNDDTTGDDDDDNDDDAGDDDDDADDDDNDDNDDNDNDDNGGGCG